ncbi:MAG: hypothetical protein B7Z36_04565 [Novosphingobium sp. 12-63-9]|nr:MAG: hypothetical protein B7Z36_04565 [Novosphingobium sp. 12-63-9]
MAEQQSGFTIGAIIFAWAELLRRHARLAGLAFGALAAAGTLVDVTLGDRGGQIVGSIATFFVQYLVAEHVLRAEGMFDQSLRGRRYASVFGASILTTLGGLAGMILLVLPGFYVLARWSLTVPIIIAEGKTATDAIGESWRRTETSVWPIFAIYLVCLLGVLAMAAAIGGLTAVATGSADGLPVLLLTNSFSAAVSIFGSILTIALYALLGHSQAQYDDIFA